MLIKMIGKNDEEPRHQLLISIMTTCIIGLILYFAVPVGYKNTIRNTIITSVCLLGFSYLAHYIDKDTDNFLLQLIRSAGTCITDNKILVTLILIPGIPP